VQRVVDSSVVHRAVLKGREFSSAEVELIREVVATCRGLSRQELASTVCELLGWQRPGGGLKTLEGKELLARLEADGLLELPPLASTKPRGSHTSVPRTARGEPQERLTGTVSDVAPVVVRPVSCQSDRLLWRELVGRYHYLGHKVPFGAHLRYLVEVSRPSPRVVGCLQASSPAWKMAPRDRWIGWSDAVRQRHLQLVVNNSRFLLLPWVEVHNLASSVLALLARQLPADWERAYGVRPVLLETLVDEQRFTGTCYRAANWVWVGVTQGRGRMDRANKLQGASPKTIFVYPLHRRARQLLCQVEG
jgi:Druantia protein DruA